MHWKNDSDWVFFNLVNILDGVHEIAVIILRGHRDEDVVQASFY